MYLPDDMPDTKVLITVKTYPLPSHKYEELVCTAGLLEDGKWIRIYPVPFRALGYSSKYSKFDWIQLNLVRNSKNDFRPESYRPKLGFDEPILQAGHIGTERGWAERKAIVIKNVHTSMSQLIELAKGDSRTSLATLKPLEMVDFVIEAEEREWKDKWLEQLQQYRLFEPGEEGKDRLRNVVRKLPYKYSYVFLTEGDKRPRKLMIEDWEIGALYWTCLKTAGGDEEAANKLVRQKYYDTFLAKKDIYLFVGITLQYHQRNAPNPFVIIGVFYPPKSDGQLSLF